MQNSLLPAPQNPGASLPPAGADLTNADPARLRSSLDSMVAAGAPNAAVQRQGRWKNGNMVARYTRGESAGEALKWLTWSKCPS